MQATSDSSECAFGGQIDGMRDYQEDCFFIKRMHGAPGEMLLLLADGMGGHAGGARASELAVRMFASHFEQSAGGIEARMREALDAANAAIAAEAEADAMLSGMGCTLLACALAGGMLHWLSVGDSPLWLLRAGEISRLNADHSMRPVLQSLVELGRMTEAELEQDNRINQLRSAVMGEDIRMVDQSKSAFLLTAGDRIILASDGVETLRLGEISGICGASENPADSVTELLREITARQVAKQDNATVIVYKHVDGMKNHAAQDANAQQKHAKPKDCLIRRIFNKRQ
ncbi:MAG: serine/threonine-protein phosphatase [Gammaproteobacteria bacterium]